VVVSDLSTRHDVWVNPDNTDHVIVGDDGGVWYSYDGGNTWWKGNNLPISHSIT